MTERWMGLDLDGNPMGTPQPRPQMVTIWYGNQWITTNSSSWDDATFNSFNWFKLDLPYSEDYTETGYTYTAPETVIRVHRTFNLTNAYNRCVGAINSNRDAALQAVALPYSPSERETWAVQAAEAAAYLADTSADVPMLAAMVAASDGAWTLAGLAGIINDNAQAYAAAAGDVLGQVKSKIVALNAIRDGIIAGTVPENDIVDFDPTISPPTVSLEDKF